MKYILIVLLTLITSTGYTSAQSLEIECTIYRRTPVYITLTPAHYDVNSLPPLGSKVMLSVYVKDNLPEGKHEGYYALYLMEVIKYIPETKSVTFKSEHSLSDLEDKKKEYGLPDLRVTSESRVKISWGE